jgi:DNA-binding MarR family transcriptional regulator
MSCKYITSLISLTDEAIKKLIVLKFKESGVKDLLPAHASVLAILYANKGKLRMSDIARMLNRDKSTITILVLKMQQNKYLKKTQCENDKRVFYISLTNKSLKMQTSFQKMSKSILDISYNGFSEREKDLIISLLQKIKLNFEKCLNNNAN